MYLKPKMTIGVIALSFGVTPDRILRYNNAKRKFIELGYNIVESNSIFNLDKARSNRPNIIAKEFMDMYLSDDIDFIMSVAGGELMMEILEYIDFELLKKAKPKMIMGYSDNTNLTLTLLTKLNIKSIYGYNFQSFGMNRWHKSLINAYKIMKGEKIIQESFNKYEIEGFSDKLKGFNMKKKVTWKYYNSDYMEGILIGGCLDCINVLAGTKFDNTLQYIADKRVIWYFDICDYSILQLYRGLWQLKNMGYFNNCNGIMLSRFYNNKEMFKMNLDDVIIDVLGDLNIPVIYDCCIGHLPPSMTLVNGSYAKVYIKNNKGYLEME